MYVYITISNVGGDAGPFDLYSNVDSYLSAFAEDVPVATLEAGASFEAPDGTTIVKIQSANSLCFNFVNVGISVPIYYYFEPLGNTNYQADFVDGGTYAYVYGYFNGYWSADFSQPGNHLVKLNTDRSVDQSFDILEGIGFHTVFLGATLKELPDLSLIVVGFFLTFNGDTVNRILRLLPNGEYDPEFNSGTGFNNYTTSVQADTSGRLYITGRFTSYDGIPCNRLVRLTSTGSFDASYDTGTGFNNATIFSLLNDDGSIYISGYFTQYDGSTVPTGIVKLDENAVVDATFDAGVGFNVGNLEPISMARITGEDAFYCAGYFTQYKGVAEPYIVKLLKDGSKDPSFDAGTGFNNTVSSIKVIFNDRLLVTGAFSSYNGETSFNHIILNKDGTVYLTFPVNYFCVYVIGNNLYGSNYSDFYNNIIYVHDPSVTTTTTTTVAPTTTTTTTV